MFKKVNSVTTKTSMWNKKQDELTLGESLKASVIVVVVAYGAAFAAGAAIEHSHEIAEWTKRKVEAIRGKVSAKPVELPEHSCTKHDFDSEIKAWDPYA